MCQAICEHDFILLMTIISTRFYAHGVSFKSTYAKCWVLSMYAFAGRKSKTMST